MRSSVLLIIITSISPLFSAITPVGPINFGKGWNISQIATDIDDRESPSLCNCLSTVEGEAVKRNGSERFIRQAISSFPVTSVYRHYASSTAATKKAVIVSNWDRLLYSTGGVENVWVTMSSNLAIGQHWSWVSMNNYAIGVGDGLSDNIKQFDVFKNTVTDLVQADGSTDTINIRAKYATTSKNYLILGNVAVSSSQSMLKSDTTYYASRVYYSILNKPSSMTAQRFIEFRTDDGEGITGLGNMFDRTHIFKPSSIGELQFSVLNLPSRGGDWVFSEVVTGFGLRAPRSLANTGQFYVLAADDGIRLWDGGRRSRLTIAEESKIISGKIQPLIEKLKQRGTYDKIVGKYYRKNEWYVVSYEDPDGFPRGVNNSVVIYDFKIGEWFPICNWLADSFETFDGSGDSGELVYGDSNDGYLHVADLNIRVDDSRKEIVLDVMDSTQVWSGGRINQDVANVKEGTASVRTWTTATITESSATLVKVFPAGEWYDKTKVSKDDKVSFKVFPVNIASITSIRLDLEINSDLSVQGAFDTNFTSVTISSKDFVNGDNAWSTIEVKLSSFQTRSEWTDLLIESFTFANTLTYYGARFVVTGIGISSISIDDFRIVGASENIVEWRRSTKLFDFGTIAYKNVGQIVLTADIPHDTSFKFDIYNDFGKKVKTESVEASIEKEIVVFGLYSTASVALMNSTDFSIKRSSNLDKDVFLPMNGAADRNVIIFGNRAGDQIVKMNRSNFGVIISSYGSFGSGTTNQNVIHQVDILDANDTPSILFCDIGNQRIKKHRFSDLSFMQTVGSLGLGATNFHQPTGIAVDNDLITVADESNYRLKNLSVSTMGTVSSVLIDYNTVGESSLEKDSEFVYLAYNKIPDDSVDFQDVILEKRDKVSLGLLNRVTIRPKNSVSLSTYAIIGDIGLLGRYIFIAFTSDMNDTTTSVYYIQKRLKSDFSLVSEYIAPNKFYGLAGFAYSYKPTLSNITRNLESEGRYLQIHFYDDKPDNSLKLYNQTFLMEVQPITY